MKEGPMDGSQILTLLMGALGSGGALAILASGVVKHMSGAAGREQQRNADAIAQRDAAWARMEELEKDKRELMEAEAGARREARRVAEYASSLRRQLLEAGASPLPWPSRCPDVTSRE